MSKYIYEKPKRYSVAKVYRNNPNNHWPIEYFHTVEEAVNYMKSLRDTNEYFYTLAEWV